MPKPHSEKNGSGHETNSPKLAQWVYCQVTSRSTASYQWECVSILPWSPVIFSYSHLATISLRVNSLDTRGDSAWQDVNKRNCCAYSGWSQAVKDVVSPYKLLVMLWYGVSEILLCYSASLNQIWSFTSLPPPPFQGLGKRLESYKLISL